MLEFTEKWRRKGREPKGAVPIVWAVRLHAPYDSLLRGRLSIVEKRSPNFGSIQWRNSSPSLIGQPQFAYTIHRAPELIVGAVGLDALILHRGQHLDRLEQCLTAEITTLREGQAQLAERVARIEGSIVTALRLSPPDAA